MKYDQKKRHSTHSNLKKHAKKIHGNEPHVLIPGQKQKEYIMN